MSYEFKRLSDVEVVAEPIESANVFIEEDGVIKKAPKTAIGGKEFEQVQSDWLQNDETASDFIKNRTHYKEVKEVGGDTLSWDGNTEGRVTVELGGQMMVHISDAVPTLEDCTSGTHGVYSNGNASDYPYAAIEGGTAAFGVLLPYDGVMVAAYDGQQVDVSGGNGVFLTFPKAGVYTVAALNESGLHLSSLTIPGYTGFKTMQTVVKTIDPEYLPEALHFGEEVKVVEGDTLVWDGNIEGLGIADMDGRAFYCISDACPTVEDCKNGVEYAFYYDDGSEPSTYTGSYEEIQAIYAEYGITMIAEGIWGIPEDGKEVFGAVFPKKGIYTIEFENEHITHMTITIPGYTGFKTVQTTVTPIQTKFLPEHLQFGTQKTVGDTLSWDGNTSGRVYVDMDGEGMYHISDTVLTEGDLSKGYTVGEMRDGETLWSEEMDDCDSQGGITIFGAMFSIAEDNLSFEGTVFPKKGIYIASDMPEEGNTVFLTIPGYGKFESETVKKLDPKYYDQPCYTEPTGGDTLIWDGNTDGLDSVDYYGAVFLRISDAIVTFDDCKNNVVYSEEGAADKTIVYENIYGMSNDICGGEMVFITGNIVCAWHDNSDCNGVVFPKAGVYTNIGKKISITLPGYTGFPGVKKLDAKYIPMDAIFDEIEKRFPSAEGGSY